MIFVEKIKIVENTSYPGSQILKLDFEMVCNDVNIFVGNQGTGKSTILKLLQKNDSSLKLSLSEYTIKNSVKSYYFDTEKDNPRMKNPELFTTPSGEDIGIGFIGASMTRFKSHGEIMEKFIIGQISKAKNCVLLIDEPESGLSLTNQFKMVKEIKKAVKRKCQFFIATHCYPLIHEFDVISLEHWEKMRGVDFINKISQV